MLFDLEMGSSQYLLTSVLALALILLLPSFAPRRFQKSTLGGFLRALRVPFVELTRHTIGRVISTKAAIAPPTLSQVQGVARDAVFVQWAESNIDSWLLHRVEVQTALLPSPAPTKLTADAVLETAWTSHPLVRQSECEILIEKLEAQRQHAVRVRTCLGSSVSSWTLWTSPVWTLCERTPEGGAVGPRRDGGEYRWSQSDIETEVSLSVPVDLKRRDLQVAIKRKTLSVSVRDKVVVDGELCKEISADDSFWELIKPAKGGDVQSLQITLCKEAKMKNWDCVIKGHPPIELFCQLLR